MHPIIPATTANLRDLNLDQLLVITKPQIRKAAEFQAAQKELPLRNILLDMLETDARKLHKSDHGYIKHRLAIVGHRQTKCEKETAPRVSVLPWQVSIAIHFAGQNMPCGIGCNLESTDGQQLTLATRSVLPSDTECLYWALLTVLRFVQTLSIKHLCIKLSNEKILQQIQYAFQRDRLEVNPLLREVQQQLNRLAHVEFVHIPLEFNTQAYQLAKQATTSTVSFA